jgi:hypothetical protein
MSETFNITLHTGGNENVENTVGVGIALGYGDRM